MNNYSGSLTNVLKIERLDPKTAAKLREEIHYQKHEKVRETKKVAAENKKQESSKKLLKANCNLSNKLHGNKILIN